MATRVTYTGKDGRECSAVYPTRELAERVARTLRNPVLCDVAAAVAPVSVRKCPDGTPEAQRAATRRHYETDDARAAREAREDRAADREHSYEREAEFWAESRAAGQSREDAWTDRDYLARKGAF